MPTEKLYDKDMLGRMTEHNIKTLKKLTSRPKDDDYWAAIYANAIAKKRKGI